MELKLGSVTIFSLLFLSCFQALKLDATHLDRLIRILSQANFPWDDHLATESSLSLPALKAASNEILHREPDYVNGQISKFKAIIPKENILESLTLYLRFFQRGTLFFQRVEALLNHPPDAVKSIEDAVKARFDCIFEGKILNEVVALGIPLGQFTKYAKVYSCSNQIVTSLTMIDPFGFIQEWLTSNPNHNTPDGLESFFAYSSRETASKNSQKIIAWYATILDGLSSQYQPYCCSGNLVTSLLLWRIIQLLHSSSKLNVKGKLKDTELQNCIEGFIQLSMNKPDIHTEILSFLMSKEITRLLLELLNGLSFEEFVSLSNLLNRTADKVHENDVVDYAVASVAIISCIGIGTGWFIYLKFS
jgi:hypothetical protein